MKKILLFTLLLICFEFSFAQKEPKDQRKDRKTERRKAVKKRLESKKVSPYIVNSEQNKLYKAGKQKLEYATRQSFDMAGAVESNSKIEYTYDSNGWLTEDISKIWDEGASQQLNSKNEYTRDSKGNISTNLSFAWDTTAGWVKSANSEYTYITHVGKTLLKSETFIIYEEDGSKINMAFKTEYEYDVNGLLIANNYSDWDTTQIYVPSAHSDYTNDGKGNMIKEIYSSWNSDTKKYDTIYKDENTYNTNNKMTLSLYSEWDQAEEKWVISMNDVYTYDVNNNMLTNISTQWDSDKSQWINFFKEQNIFDSKSNRTFSSYLYWNDSASEWDNSYKIESSFDDKVPGSELILPYGKETIDLYFKTKLLQETEYEWDEVSGKWVKTSNTINTYKMESGSINIPQTNFNISVYPNPSHDKFFIELQNYSPSMEVKVYDMSGKLIQSNEMDNKGFIDIDNLKSGVYILQINEGFTILGNRKLVVD